MTNKHSPTPTPWKVAESVVQKDAWYLEGLYNDQWIPIGDDDGTMDFDDAAYIVEAVNAHKELLEVCRQLIKYAWANHPDHISIELRAIINQACNATANARGK